MELVEDNDYEASYATEGERVGPEAAGLHLTRAGGDVRFGGACGDAAGGGEEVEVGEVGWVGAEEGGWGGESDGVVIVVEESGGGGAVVGGGGAEETWEG